MAGAIRFRTISHDDRSNFDADAFLAYHDYLRESFPLVHERAELTVINDYSLLYRISGSDPSLKPVMLMGHMDVVPVDDVTLAEWTHDPFAGEVFDGEIWGRGTLDDKLSVMSFLEAVEALIGDGFAPRRTLYLSFGHDEEVGGRDGAKAVAEHLEQQGIEFGLQLVPVGAWLFHLLMKAFDPVADQSFAQSANDGNTAADDAIGAKNAELHVGNVHGTALAFAVAGCLAVELGEHGPKLRTLGDGVTMTAVWFFIQSGLAVLGLAGDLLHIEEIVIFLLCGQTRTGPHLQGILTSNTHYLCRSQ